MTDTECQEKNTYCSIYNSLQHQRHTQTIKTQEVSNHRHHIFFITLEPQSDSYAKQWRTFIESKSIVYCNHFQNPSRGLNEKNLCGISILLVKQNTFKILTLILKKNISVFLKMIIPHKGLIEFMAGALPLMLSHHTLGLAKCPRIDGTFGSTIAANLLESFTGQRLCRGKEGTLATRKIKPSTKGSSWLNIVWFVYGMRVMVKLGRGPY